MNVQNLLSENTININLEANDKIEAINKMVDLISKSNNITDVERFKEEVFKRESLSSTGIGEGIAIPHAKSEYVKAPTIAIGIFLNKIDYSSVDNEKVDLIFLLAAPPENDTHLEILSKLSSLLLDEKFVYKIRHVNEPSGIIEIISKKVEETAEKRYKKYNKILAVTACPTGIAHTYMAEEALYEGAKKLGVSIKIETNGSSGVRNELTEEDIKNSDVIIVAADKNVDINRFIGRKVLFVNTSKAIKESTQILQKAMSGNVPFYRKKDDVEVETTKEFNESLFRKVYKHLMNGVSHMLPFVIGGGILIAIAFLIDSKNAGSPNFGSINPVAKIFKSIGGYSFNFMLPILAAFIASSIADRPGLAVGFVGGYMATLPNASFIETSNDASAGFLGALVAGFVSGYILLGLKYITRKFPKSLNGIKPTLIYPVFGILIIGVLMYFVINAPFSFINNLMTNGLNSLNTESGIILGVILAAMMSIDMGGPINKAAYVFGTAAVTTRGFEAQDMVDIAEFIKLTATDFENSADYVREKVTAICDKYPLYK